MFYEFIYRNKKQFYIPSMSTRYLSNPNLDNFLFFVLFGFL